jgi:chemotaxis protein histidine kinase CheA
MEEKKKERTIRSETTKVFLVIFAILAVVGVFTIFSAMKGASTFTRIKDVHLQQFKAAESMKQKALDVISIYYLLATDQDLNVLMQELLRYKELVKVYEDSGKFLAKSLEGEEGGTKEQVLKLLAETKVIFDKLNIDCRNMTFSMMEGNKEKSKKFLPAINEGIGKFKIKLDEIEEIVAKQLDQESLKAQSLLHVSTITGIVVTILAIFITLALINYLMKFLSVSLLPISNLMHNMRQAVFSVDKQLTVISPVSNYSSVVFDQDIVGKPIENVVFKDTELAGEAYAQHKTAMEIAFGEDEFQWNLVQDSLLRQVKLRSPESSEDKYIKLSYAPLLEKGVIQNVMIVAEDVTEVEKLRIDSMGKQAKIEIIKGLMGMNPADLDSFLQTSYEQVKLCYSLVPFLENDLTSRQSLFRTLHTLKGNSRMYQLNTISEIVHETENTLVSLNAKINDKEPIVDTLKAIQHGLKKTESALAEHCKIASSFFGIKDYYSEHALSQIIHAVLATEAQTNKEDDLSALESAVAAATYFESEELSALFKEIEGSLQSTDSIGVEKVEQLQDKFFEVVFKKSLIRPLQIDVNDCEEIFSLLVQITVGLETMESKVSLKEQLLKFITLNDKYGIIIPSHASTNLVKNLEQVTSEQKNAYLKKVWSVFATYSSLDMLKKAEDSKDVHSFVHSDKFQTGILKENNIEFLCVLSSYLTSIESLFIPVNQFWSMAAKVFNVSMEEAVKRFTGAGTTVTSEAIIDILKDGKFGSWKDAAEPMMKTPFAIMSLSNENNILFKLDSMRLMVSFRPTNSLPVFGMSESMIKIPEAILTHISEIALKIQSGKMTDQNLVAKELNRVIQQVYETPVSSMLLNMSTMVQELAGRLGKSIEYKVTGDQVYLSREKASVLRDALVHLIRNTIDHGLEMPEDRLRLSKPEKGLLNIVIEQKEDKVIFTVRDDGKGMDEERLAKKAVSNGIISAEQAEKLTQQEKVNLAFLPNLSTKEEITSISGRGVGMDAVKKFIEGIDGNVNISSRKGLGVAVSISFDYSPLSGANKTTNDANSVIFNEHIKSMGNSVADLSRSLGKEVEFTITGKDLIFPRPVANSIRDALTHLVRNSVDHGIERLQERERRSKNLVGKVEVTSSVNDGEVIISVIDDGGGVNTEKLLAKAISIGIVDKDKASAMTPNEILELVFKPNLSTKEEISAISGRGVGMDAVKTIVEGLKGNVSIESDPDKGVKVVMKFKEGLKYEQV